MYNKIFSGGSEGKENGRGMIKGAFGVANEWMELKRGLKEPTKDRLYTEE
jgi:hypothetical protein